MKKTFLLLLLILIYNQTSSQTFQSLDSALMEPEKVISLMLDCSEKERINEIQTLSSLRSLYLRNCNYKKIPDVVIKLPKLTLLNIESNRLLKLPSSIFKENVVEFKVPFTAFVKFLCHPPFQVPYRLTL